MKRKKERSSREEKQEDRILSTVISGDKDKVLDLVKDLLKKMSYEKVIEDVLRPALDQVGKLYEKREIFLPQLIMAAETAQTAFGFIEKKFAKKKIEEGVIIIATVRGDIHDIGKNIVAMMLKNAGFDVTDLGKDVPSEEIIKVVKEKEATIIALSALMTTTALRMKEVIELVKKEHVPVKVIVGGACITEKFAADIGADAFASDASAAVTKIRQLIKTK